MSVSGSSAAAAPVARRKTRSARRRARLAAVQALYQVSLVGTDPEQVIAQFAERQGKTGRLDFAFFSRLVLGAAAAAEALDHDIADTLAPGWRLERLSATMRGLLRAAAFELRSCPDVPVRVSVSEYVDIAGSFFDHAEIGFVNAALETLARRLRAEEWQTPAGPARDDQESG
jgi:N utilization substance protein B